MAFAGSFSCGPPRPPRPPRAPDHPAALGLAQRVHRAPLRGGRHLLAGRRSGLGLGRKRNEPHHDPTDQDRPTKSRPEGAALHSVGSTGRNTTRAGIGYCRPPRGRRHATRARPRQSSSARQTRRAAADNSKPCSYDLRQCREPNLTWTCRAPSASRIYLIRASRDRRLGSGRSPIPDPRSSPLLGHQQSAWRAA